VTAKVTLFLGATHPKRYRPILPVLFILTDNNLFFYICLVLAAVYGSYYAVWTMIAIPRYHRQLKEKFSYTENIELKWVRTIMFSFFTMLGLYVIDSIIANIMLECLYMIGTLALWMCICYFLYRHESVMSELIDCEPINAATASMGQNDELSQRIERLFVIDKIYLNPTLKLSDVASLACTNRTYISQFFNKSKDSSFYAYVNRYRIDHACALLTSTNDTIEVVAEQSGFNSKATFYRVFTETMGCSPTNFRQKGK
jgi:AraC-like DNA-binding protein